MKTDTILELIRMLSSQGASGTLQINTGTTKGTISFDRGQIIDARLGKLTGFQAINTLASLPEATYNYDEATTRPAESRITPNERMLLKDFYGIEPGEPNQSDDVPLESWMEDDLTPARVVSLSNLEDSESAVRYANDQSDGPGLTNPSDNQEATLVSRRTADAEARRPWITQRIARSFFGPVVFAILLVVVIGVGAIVLVQRFHRRNSTASVGPTIESTVQTTSPAPEPKNDEIPDLTGNWKVINTVQQTAYEAYRNMEVGFTLSINQAGKDFTGKGEKVSENGQSLPADGRTAIEVKGTIDGDKIEATFVENGTLRKTNGRFVWRINKGGGLTGTFNSTAARTSGRSAATKVS
jgi:Domain of unknown function (DUF4388)